MSSSFELNLKKNIFFDESSLEKPEPITKKKQKTFKELKKVALNQIHKRYGPKAKLKYSYKGLIMENLIFNKNTHLVSVFKDYMIWDYIEEFLKRFYKSQECNERVPKFASFYKNYLKFFCVPTFKDIFCNEMIHNYSEKKAELFYNENYKTKKEKNSFQEDYGLLEESESDEESETSNANNNIEKTIFNETVKKKIEKYSPINTSMALPESDTKLKPDDSGLLITSSNETSLINIMKGMSHPHPPGPIPKSKKYENLGGGIKENKNNNSKSKNQKSENSNSYRMNQRNLIHSSLNKFNSKTLETLLNSQMKNRNNRNKNIIHYNNYSNLAQRNHTNRVNSKDNNQTNSNNVLVKNNLQNKNLNKNKIMSYIGIYKKKSVPKSRNEDKSPEEIVKSQTQINNYINGSSNSNNNINNNNNNIDNLKNNKINLNLNQLGNTLSTRTKNITSINNYNLNYKQSIQKGRNQQQSISINSNTYSKYSFDRINNVKKKINLFKNNNIEYILNQLKFRPFCTLKKNSKRKVVQSNSNRNKKEEKKSAKKTELNINNNKERNTSKIRTLNGRTNDISPNAKKTKFQNSPSALDFLKKTSEYIRSMNGKGSYTKDIKLTKKTERNCSYNEWQKSYGEDKNNNINKTKNVNIINNKIPFDGILANANNNKKSRTLNNNGSKHIHNVNININNQINIGGKQFHELFSFSDLVKKNSVNANIKNLFSLARNKDKKTNYVSRNKNQSLDFNSYTNNQTNNMNSIGSNKMNSIGEPPNNNIYKTQYKINNSKKFDGSNNLKNKNGNKKIRLTNNALFRSMRIINNNNNYIHNNKLKKQN